MTTAKQPSDNQARRRREILDVAARLFAERGFNGTSMDDIAKELGILKGSLYYWIDSKEALLEEVLAISPMLEEIEAGERLLAADLPASEQLRELIHYHIDAWVRHPHNFRVFLDYSYLESQEKQAYYGQRDTLEKLFKRAVRAGIARGEFQLDPADVSIAVNSIFGIMNWFPRWYRADGPSTWEHIAEVMTEMVLNGLSGGRREKGAEGRD